MFLKNILRNKNKREPLVKGTAPRKRPKPVVSTKPPGARTGLKEKG